MSTTIVYNTYFQYLTCQIPLHRGAAGKAEAGRKRNIAVGKEHCSEITRCPSFFAGTFHLVYMTLVRAHLLKIEIICETRIPLSRACCAGSDFNSPIGRYLGTIPGSRKSL